MELFDNSVLLVDDDEAVINTLRFVLKRVVPTIYTAVSGKKALDIVKNYNIDLVILDIMMPDMNGLKVLKRMKKYDPSITCVMFTGFADKDKVISALKHGAYDFLEKPASLEIITNCVTRCLEKINYEVIQKELLEILLFHYSNVEPKKFFKLSDSEKQKTLKSVLGLMKVKVLNEKTANVEI